MKVFHVSWNAHETVLHEMLWKQSFTVYPCLQKSNTCDSGPFPIQFVHMLINLSPIYSIQINFSNIFIIYMKIKLKFQEPKD